jgi:hypothetical protein
MCIFRTKSELEKLQSQLNEVKLQAEKDEQLVKQLQEEIAEHKRIKSLLLRKIETLMKDEPLVEEENTTNVEDKEFVTGDKEFAIKTRKMVCKTEDEEYIIPTTNNYCDAIETEAKLLAKELIHLWAFREEHRDAPLGGFSNINGEEFQVLLYVL